jgi:hypothetical protein
LNGADRARRQQVSRIREAEGPVDVDEVYCDITALLFDEPKGKKIGEGKEIPDMILSDSSEKEDENLDDIGRDFEIIESGDLSEHNGTERRWYRGFRH